MIEIEKRYLAKYLPADLDLASSYYVEDIYFSFSTLASLRLRRKDEKYMIDKKIRMQANDASQYYEQSIELTVDEYRALAQAPGWRVAKRRYVYRLDDVVYEIGVFDKELTGLVTIEIEFSSRVDYDGFVKPDFCGVDVTQESWILGSQLAGKSYSDIAGELEKFGYQAIIV